MTYASCNTSFTILLVMIERMKIRNLNRIGHVYNVCRTGVWKVVSIVSGKSRSP